MNSRLKPVSRLSIVFILAVVISGSLLTYFSINNISSLKNLTERRILEEQRELSTRFSSAIQSKIEKVTFGFKGEIGSSGLLKDSLIKTTANYDFITLPFILKNDGSLLYPYFLEMIENKEEPRFSNRFKSAFQTGEEAEFAKKNLRTAKKQYLLCINYSMGAKDLVKALNALARVYVKLNQHKEAINYYSLIIEDNFQESTTNGYPYVYYALPQLLKISNPDNCEDILPLIEFCLKKMEVGLIPLNFSTEELLPLIQKWVDENTFKNTERLSHINELERNINQQLRFTKEYGNELSKLVREGGLENHSTIGNNFKVVNIFSGNNLKLILINPSLKNPAGFLIDREKLLVPIVESNLQADFEFEYKIEFPSGYNPSSNEQQLTFSSQLNPYFSGQMMLISLSDENLIKDIIRSRSWIYGIATVLLLVAMFLGVALIIRDSAREKHLARMRSDFISNVTHELKTPLTSIYMFAESLLLGRIKSTDGKKEYLTIILKESERLKRMINNILEFSKMEDGKPEYHFEHSNLASLLNATISDMNYWFEEENFDIVSELDENISADVDPEKMQQLISNLLNNAFKYSAETKSIIIRLFQKANQIYLEIEDEGIGIAEDQLTKIFEKFYRIDQKESISGTGLGLTVVKEIIEAHHGKIFVTSKMGKGSKFSIILNQQISKG